MDYSKRLDDDILEKIVRDHLSRYYDRYHFSLVCKSWNSVALRHPQRLPGLLSRLPDDHASLYHFLPISLSRSSNGIEPSGSYTSNPFRRRSTEILPRVNLPIVHYPRSSEYHDGWNRIVQSEEIHIVACLDGWLLIADPRTTSGRLYHQLELCLFNPITRATIALPDRPPTMAKLLSSRDDIIKAVLSSSPDNIHVDCHAIVLLKSTPYLAWCKVLGEGRGWKLLSNEIFETGLMDVSYYGETLYVRDSRNVYVVRDLIVASSHGKHSVRAVSMPSLQYYCRMAPDLAGQLLMIFFRESVHKLVVSSSGDYEWEKLKSLDGYALFVGSHQSFCIPASDDHNRVVIANRIYSPSCVSRSDNGCSAYYYIYTTDCLIKSSFWFLPMPRDVIGEHIRSEEGVSMSNCKYKYKGFSYWTDSKVFEGNRFQALLSTEDDE
ncbi:hypothetical protein LINGRAHAP2_LOCUS13172 [Linum grandiflorum]